MESQEKKTSFLVTGGAGFIGSNCVENLLRKGHQVRVIDNLSTGKMENIAEFLTQIEFIQANVQDAAAIKKAMAGMDYVIHLAAVPSVQFSIDDPIGANESMVTSTVTLLKAAVDHGKIKRIVQATSAAAYGDSPELPKRETMLPEPLSPYAAAKLSQESYGAAFAHVFGLQTTSLRFFNVYGPKQDPASPYSGVISIFMDKLLAGENPQIFGDGANTRDFVYVGDVAEAVYQACISDWPGKSEVINIGTGKATSLNELVAALNKVLADDITAIYKAARTGDVKYSYADISKARQLLGYEPKVEISAGLARLVSYIKKEINKKQGCIS